MSNYYSKDFSVYTLSTLPHIESTYDEEDSHYVLNELISSFENFLVYDSNKNINHESIVSLCNTYSLFHASITHKDIVNFKINIPLAVFRFIMLEDLSWSLYEARKREPGYVVEGMFWTNGMIYQVREDKETDFEVHQVCLYIDRNTARLHSYPFL
jgi:hypothetical protein